MKKIIALALLTSFIGAAAPAFAQNANDGLCGPDGPEAYKRPGGYCEQVGKSLLTSDNDDQATSAPVNKNYGKPL